jgi:hypothetical protein
MHLTTTTTTDLAEFLLLPADVRQEIESWQAELANVTRPIQRALSNVAARMGVSLQTARRKYDAWRKAGRSWRALINRAKVPEDRGLDPDFIEYWKKLCEQNTRKFRPAYREFVRQYKSGAPIPGLPPGISRKSLPPGFSYDNLLRHKPTPFETAATRIGRGAAADFRPKVLTTRVGLSVGQRYIFDDLWHDFKVVTIGSRKPGRLLQLHAHDLFSACQFARGLKARLEDPETGSAVGLKEDEMLFLLAHVFSEFGFHPDGTVCMVEHGTAAIRDDLEKVLFDLTAGKVTVARSGIDGDSSFAGQYSGRGKGNFRFKAALESLGNLIHNETANLLQFPGQTGSNSRINCPEELHGRERHADQLALAMVALPPHVVSQLKLDFVECTLGKWLVDEVMERINRRTAHELEGWLEAGLTTIDFEIPGVGLLPPEKVLALPPEKQAAVKAVANPLPRKLSPRDVFDQGRSHLVRFRPEQSAALLATRQGHEVTVNDEHLIVFEDQSISPEPLRYLAHHFAPGDKFRAVVNPWATSALHLFDARGRWIGQVKAWQRVQHDDIAALHAQMGRAAKIEKELLSPVAARGAELTRTRLENTRANIDALSHDKKHARQIRKHEGDMSELVEPSMSSPSPGGEGRGEGEPFSEGDHFSSSELAEAITPINPITPIQDDGQSGSDDGQSGSDPFSSEDLL